ncbi:zf-C2H2 zinc finger, C2H2 type [Scheffersomyces amazonensis]|uniref:zf-C2H2 zinc finger, C2H2 type n=1 Tax=Scheffersomyces amazonensis TaxID=1078765 RepID=UPI00315CD96D
MTNGNLPIPKKSSSAVNSTTTTRSSNTFIDAAIISIVVRLLQVGISFILSLIVPFPESLSIPSDSDFYRAINNQSTTTSTTTTTARTTKSNKSNKRKKQNLNLFPSIQNQEVKQLEQFVEEEFSDEEITIPQPCSTGLTTRLLPFKNEKGEIEWAFTEDVVPGNELEAFKINNFNKQTKQQLPEEIKIKKDEEEVNLSPTVSNSSNNESILSNSKKDNQLNSVSTPLTSHHSSPFTPDKKLLSHSSSSENLADEDSEELDDEAEGQVDGDDENKTHQCPHCEAVFKIRGYLTRHLKKHAIKKAYSCPFHSFSIYIDENNITHKCHPNGGFSRRDTYKTHLKSRHFKYPKGVKTKDRSSSGGSCSMCGEYFPNAEIWCELHVEGGECSYLPAGFKGKSRIKNKLKKRLSKKQQKELDASNLTNQVLHSTYIAGSIDPTTNTIIGNPTLPEVVSTPFVDTPHSSSGTPGGPSNLPYEYHSQRSQSPVPSLTSSISNYHSSGNLTATNSIINGNTPVSTKSPINYSQILQAQVQNQQYPRISNTPIFEQFERPIRPNQKKVEDYDDEYCLDIDQLNNATFNNYNEILHYFKNSQPQPQSQSQPSQESYSHSYNPQVSHFKHHPHQQHQQQMFFNNGFSQ